MNPSPIKEKSLLFAIHIVKLYKELSSNKEFVISKQILRSGTSIGANVQEASAAISRKDFKNKMAIASKEARETQFWLNVLDHGQIIQFNYKELHNEIEELIKMLTKIIKTTQENS